MKRIAVVDESRCHPHKCGNYLCERFCPVNRAGTECIVHDPGKKVRIIEPTCIGCNICRAANNEGVGLRCTQNPTMGEEWRRGWHPERIAVYPRREKALVIGGGPAELEAALTLGRRGLEVALAEAGDTFGGRLLREATLPGLQTHENP